MIPRSVVLLWMRATLRRFGRGMTIVLTLAIMSTATVGALVAGDTLDRLFTKDAEAEWGSVDVEVRADDNAVTDESIARTVVIEAGDTVTAGAPRLILQGVARGEATAPEKVVVLGLGGEEQQFAPLSAVDGLADPLKLGGDAVLVNERLAKRLRLAVGDSVSLTVAAPEWQEDVPTRSEPRVHQARTRPLDVRVDGVVANSGAADLHRTPNVLMRRDVLQDLTGLVGQVTTIHLSAVRHDRKGAKAVRDKLAPLARQIGLDATPVRADALSLAHDDGGLFRSILLTLAVLVILAAAVATFGLLVALGEQRAPELVVMRALGARRRVMGRLLIAESVLYGILGAVIGTAAGVPFGLGVSDALATHFADLNEGRGREQVLVQSVVHPTTVVVGCLIVAVVAGLAGRSAARIVLSADPADVLRGSVGRLRAPNTGARRAVALLAVGAFLLGVGTLAGGSVLFIGLTVTLSSGWVHGRRTAADSARFDQRAAAAGLVWSLAGATLLGGLSAGVQAGFGTIVTAGTTAILCVSVLLGQRLQAVMHWVRAYAPSGPPDAALRTSAANAQSSPRRSGTVIATFGVALFMLAAMSVLGSAQGIGLDRQSGGFDVIGTSAGAVNDQTLRHQPGVAYLAAAPESLLPEPAFSVETGRGEGKVPYPVRLIGANGAVAQAQAFGLASHLKAFPTSVAALSAVASDRDKVVLDRAALPEGAEVGDDVAIDIGSSPRRFRLIAVLDTFLLSGAFVNQAEFGELVPNRGNTMVFASASDGVSAKALASSLEAAGRDAGLTVDPVAKLRDDVIAVNRTFTDTFAVMLVLALAVALASVAAYVALAVRERRGELALLYALGLRYRSVVVTVAAEPILTGGLGATVGLAVGLIYLRVLFAVGFSELAFIVDWVRVGVVAGATILLLAATCLVTARLTTPRDLSTQLRDVG